MHVLGMSIYPIHFVNGYSSLILLKFIPVCLLKRNGIKCSCFFVVVVKMRKNAQYHEKPVSDFINKRNITCPI